VTQAEMKVVRYIAEQASDLYAAGMGNKPIFDNRDRMRASIGQYVAEQVALINVPGSLAEWVIAANHQEEAARMAQEKTT
jgi:hypothetical protein